MTYNMNRNLSTIGTWALLFALIPQVLAQNVATVDQGSESTTMSEALTSFASLSLLSGSSYPSATPTSNDNAPSGNNNHGFNSTGLVNYYFVFIALILCVVGAGVFTILRRRNRMAQRARLGQGQALQRDFGGSGGGGGGSGWANWNPERARGRYWQGRWRSAEVSREEGLNEYGEAPPAYVPKRRSEEGQERRAGEGNGPAIPLQTLSREDAGLKPPDYSEASSHGIDSHARNSSASAASASSSRDPGPQRHL